MNSVSRAETVAVPALVGAALILRVINLDAGLWYDEALTLTQSVRLPPAELFTTYGSLNNHVLYTWLAKASVALFGEEPWSLRAPAVLFGVASIVAAWALFREGGWRWAAVVTAALLAVSYHHVWFSQNARGYTGLLLFTTIAAFALHRALRGAPRYWLLYAASFAAAMLVHLSAAFLFVAQGIVVLLHGAIVVRKQPSVNFWRWIKGPAIGFGVGSVVVVVAFLPMLGGMIDAFTMVAGPAPSATKGVVEWKNPVWTAMETIRSFGAIGFALPLAAGFAVIGIRSMMKRAPWIAAPYLIHIPLTLVILGALSMRIWPRYFFIDIAFMMAAVVVGAFVFADFVSQRLKLNPVFLKAAGSTLMVGLSIPLLLTNYKAPKQDFEGAYELIMRERRPGDAAATLGLAGLYFHDYRSLDWPAVEDAGDLSARAGRLWVVTAFPAHTRALFPDAQTVLDSDFELVRTFKGTLSDGDVLVYRSREP